MKYPNLPRIHIDVDGLWGTPSAYIVDTDDVWAYDIDNTHNGIAEVYMKSREAGYHIESLGWDSREKEWVGPVTKIDSPPPPPNKARRWKQKLIHAGRIRRWLK
jgi:hypothetical protein